MKLYKLLYAFACTALMSACGNDFLDIDPTAVATEKQIDALSPAQRDSLVSPLIKGLYSHYAFTSQSGGQSSHEDYGIMGTFLITDSEGEDIAYETRPGGIGYDHIFEYRESPYVRSFGYWSFFYTVISQANNIISKIPETTTSIGLRAIKGQALTFRALGYSYLIQMFQKTYKGHEADPGIPLILTTAEGQPRQERVLVSEIYVQIEKDYIAGIGYLKGWDRENKSQIDENVAKGLLARTYMVMNRWEDAANMAKEARASYNIMTESELKNSNFGDINNSEWMWGYDISAETTKMFASFFSWTCSFDEGYGGAVGAYRKIDARLYSKMEATDVRKTQFVGPGEKVHVKYAKSESDLPEYTNMKFKKVNGWLADYIYMRASEMVLIEAEAYAQLGEQGKAATTLGILMTNRDPSWNETNVTADDVYTQRRLELWGEGFTFFDLVRLKKGIDRTYAGSNYYDAAKIKVPAESWAFFYQLPLREIQENEYINDADQNP